MQIEQFKRDFKRLGGVYITEKVVLFRKPLELYNLATSKSIATFSSIDSVLAYDMGGKTVADIIADWKEITFPIEHGGRGSGSGMGFSGGWPSSGSLGGGNDETTADLPARMNVKLSGASRSYADMLREFTKAHGSANEEHGFVTKYRHGNAGSISGLTGNGKEIAIHNHPAAGWPTFSKEDVINTAMGTRRGIVAVSSTAGRGEDSAKYAGTYTFIKGQRFNASGFVKGVNGAKLSGKDYNDAVNKWLKANQKKYGYTYTYVKAK